MEVSRAPADSPVRSSRHFVALLGVLAGLGAGWGLASRARPDRAAPERQAAEAPAAVDPAVALGRELFHREWTPGDPRARGGDGLGPMFTDTSCVACHNLGGSGGGGSASKNIDIVTSLRFASLQRERRLTPREDDTTPRRQTDNAPDPGVLFAKSPSVVLHRFGTEADFAAWRLGLLSANSSPATSSRPSTAFTRATTAVKPADMSPVDLARAEIRESSPVVEPVGRGASLGKWFQRSQRNPSALFGAGLIDAIPDRAILDGEGRKFAGFPEVSGRAVKRREGRVGRFGWKAQTASLDEFVLVACSVELGLEVPGHPQSADPLEPGNRSPGLDLSDADCAALVAYVRRLPAPVVNAESEAVSKGREVFESIGCAACHTPDLGPAKGLYSDLLLHDMGLDLGDGGSSYGIPSSPGRSGDVVPDSVEWRTPPLWGVRDSGPYLHDGRAETLDQAIAFHGGEAKNSSDRYFGLAPSRRWQILAFLGSLVGPGLADADRHDRLAGD
jgi:CxxC motif-containing protein (DUF1111 family)